MQGGSNRELPAKAVGQRDSMSTGDDTYGTSAGASHMLQLTDPHEVVDACGPETSESEPKLKRWRIITHHREKEEHH